MVYFYYYYHYYYPLSHPIPPHPIPSNRSIDFRHPLLNLKLELPHEQPTLSEERGISL